MLEKITSSDGTRIAFYSSGTGPPLILVPGAGAANPAAWPVARALEEHFTVYAVDRRGHGKSGDGSTYAIEREFEDIVSVVDSIGVPANVFGHSFGGLCALEAALITPNIDKLIVYEGHSKPHPGVPVYPEGYLERLEAMVEVGDREGVLIAHYMQTVGMTIAELEQFKSSPAWPERVASAQTLPRELRADDQYRFEPPRFANLRTPVLHLLGGHSPDFFKNGTEFVHASLSTSRIAVLPGQEHIAMYTAPELFLHEVLVFLIGPG